MKLEEQLIRIAVSNGLASLSIDVHTVRPLEPWIAVHAQAEIAPVARLQGNGRVGDGGIVPAIHDAIAELRAKITDHHGIVELAPLADGEGDIAQDA